MAAQTAGLSHIALRVRDLKRAKEFYAQALGFPVVLETEDLVLVNAGGALLGLRGGADYEHGAQRKQRHNRITHQHLLSILACRKSRGIACGASIGARKRGRNGAAAAPLGAVTEANDL